MAGKDVAGTPTLTVKNAMPGCLLIGVESTKSEKTVLREGNVPIGATMGERSAAPHYAKVATKSATPYVINKWLHRLPHER
jgi:hypothetical protein